MPIHDSPLSTTEKKKKTATAAAVVAGLTGLVFPTSGFSDSFLISGFCWQTHEGQKISFLSCMKDVSLNEYTTHNANTYCSRVVVVVVSLSIRRGMGPWEDAAQSAIVT